MTIENRRATERQIDILVSFDENFDGMALKARDRFDTSYADTPPDKMQMVNTILDDEHSNEVTTF